jgi:hypothetical protein
MIVEQRTYTFSPGRIGNFLEILEAEGLPLQRQYLGPMVGYYTTEIGPLNRTISMWAYEDLNDRTERRRALFADRRWQDYLAKVRPLMTSQETQILTPAGFFAPALNAFKNKGRDG